MNVFNTGVLAITHHDVPLSVREHFALTHEDVLHLEAKLLSSECVSECLILNTCNRIELYLVGSGKLYLSALHLFCEYHEVEPSYLGQYVKWHEGLQAVKHLFAVSAGLDSQIPGETEILGQVKRAYQEASERKRVGKVLNATFQKSFQSAKWIRTNTAIGKGQISLGNIAADLADRIFGELSLSRILMVGTGEIGQQALKAIRKRGDASISVASRTLGKARMIATEYDGVAIDFESIGSHIRAFDIILCATSSAHPVLTAKEVAAAMQNRVDEPLFLIDLAVPRDIEDASADITNVYLYNLDDLAAIANENLKSRKRELSKCQAVAEERAKYIWDALHQPPRENANASTQG